jgi:hypothetical protein
MQTLKQLGLFFNQKGILCKYRKYCRYSFLCAWGMEAGTLEEGVNFLQTDVDAEAFGAFLQADVNSLQ